MLCGADRDGGLSSSTASADFVRIYGGLWKESELGYAVNDFFLNGGSDAVIVRCGRRRPARQGSGLARPHRRKVRSSWKRKYPGSWGNQLKARVEVISDPAMRTGGRQYRLSMFGDTVGPAMFSA